ncbi:Uncharacterised protein [Mycobacteroides abscessus subsp. abscessus]|nr:Uncharacterised protein [Mycobacteroides abscessus subsp. abscessus]
MSPPEIRSCPRLGRYESSATNCSALAVARSRGVSLEPVAPHVVGCGRIGQAKWAAWRRKERMEAVCEADLDEQMALVSSYLDPVFDLGDTT